MRQFRVKTYARACIAMKVGGLSEYNSLPRCGINQSPESTICLATSAKRGSSAGHGSRRPMPAPISTNANSMNKANSRQVRRALAAISDMGAVLGAMQETTRAANAHHRSTSWHERAPRWLVAPARPPLASVDAAASVSERASHTAVQCVRPELAFTMARNSYASDCATGRSKRGTCYQVAGMHT